MKRAILVVAVLMALVGCQQDREPAETDTQRHQQKAEPKEGLRRADIGGSDRGQRYPEQQGEKRRSQMNLWGD